MEFKKDMAHIDLIAVLDKLSKKYNTPGKLNNIKIYGQIERVLSRPFNLKDTVVVDSKYSFVDFHCFLRFKYAKNEL